MLGLGLGLQYGGVLFAYDSQAVAHFNRVIADGGTIPAGLVGCDAWFKAVKGVYGVSDITSAISSGIHPHYLGYKAGAGSGATLGSAAQTCYNAIGSTGDVVQTTAASQPLILPHTGTNYVWLPAISGNYFSTPNNTNNQLISNFSIEINANYDSSLTNVFIGKAASVSSNASFYFFRDSSGFLRLVISTDGVNLLTYISTASTSLPYLRISRNSTTGIIKFFTSTDGVTYTQLGADVAGVTGNIFNSTSNLEVGSVFGGGSSMRGIINSVKIYKDNSFTTPTQIFNPANYSRATSATTWTSTTGEVWTINTPSTNNALKAAIVDTTYLMGNGTSMGMRAASLNMNQTGIASYTAIRKFVNASGLQIITELGTGFAATSGKAFLINYSTNTEGIAIHGNLGSYWSEYTSNSLSLKLATQINNINNANESSPYLVNNTSQAFSTAITSIDNTAAINATGYNLLARNNAASLWANVMMACDIVSKNADSTGTQTAMYNALKPFLVNAI